MVSGEYFLSRAGQQYGPITEAEFKKLIELGHLRPEDLVWPEGANDWMPATAFLGARNMGNASTPYPAIVQGEPTSPETEKQPPVHKGWINGATIFWGFIALLIVGVTLAEPASIPYRLAGAISGAVFGAIAGGLAALAQHFISKKLTAAPISIAAALGFIVGQSIDTGINYAGGEFYDRKVRPAVTLELIAQKLDAMPIYQALKRADPEAYSRLKFEISKRGANGASGSEIAKYAESFTASFRRDNADAALAASPKALATLMQSLVDILDFLRARDVSLCGEFVLQAFASDRIRTLVRDPDFSALMEKQAVNVFDAIAEGLRQKRAYEAPTEADVQAVVEGLEKRGWTDQMRTALVEPDQLRTLPPALVCRIQRELLSTLASLPEPARARWHREMLGGMLRS